MASGRTVVEVNSIGLIKDLVPIRLCFAVQELLLLHPSIWEKGLVVENRDTFTTFRIESFSGHHNAIGRDIIAKPTKGKKTSLKKIWTT